MASINATLLNQLIAGNGGHTLIAADSIQTILVDSKAVNLSSLISAAPSATTFTPDELTRFDLLSSSRQTAVYNLVNAAVATAIASGTVLPVTNWNTSEVLGIFTVPAGYNQTTVPTNQPFATYTDNFLWDSALIANEERPVEAPRNPSSTRP